VLILTASVGEGHDLPARLLRDQLERESADVEVVVVDGLRAMGRAFVLLNERAASVFFHRLRFMWDVGFGLFISFPATRRLSKAIVHMAGAKGVLRLISETRPNVVVSVYPVTTEVLGHLRRAGRLTVPAIAVVTDLAMMHYWAAPGIDLHLVTHSESETEVRSIAGSSTSVTVVRGLVRPEFDSPPEREEARRVLGLPAEGSVVLVSGGGWGVGDLAGAVEAALALDIAVVACLCGRNESLRRELTGRHASEQRLRAVGFTDRMCAWLTAADVLVHSTGGLTVLEATICGCPTISYGWGRGHLRANNDAFRRLGLAEVVGARRDLRAALARVLASEPRRRLDISGLPSAGAAVLACLA
jgi:processive 1,2-diacylglycerol beta-glucosyltransferase